MALATIDRAAEKGGRGKKSINCSETEQFSKAQLSQARKVFRYSEQLARKRQGIARILERL
jgi:hypothetical protein